MEHEIYRSYGSHSVMDARKRNWHVDVTEEVENAFGEFGELRSSISGACLFYWEKADSRRL